MRRRGRNFRYSLFNCVVLARARFQTPGKPLLWGCSRQESCFLSWMLWSGSEDLSRFNYVFLLLPMQSWSYEFLTSNWCTTVLIRLLGELITTYLPTATHGDIEGELGRFLLSAWLYVRTVFYHSFSFCKVNSYEASTIWFIKGKAKRKEIISLFQKKQTSYISDTPMKEHSR